MHDGEGRPFTFTSRDMLDTTAILHGYRYDNVPVAQEPPAPAPEVEVAMASREGPELAGASEGAVSLTGDVTTDRGQAAPADGDALLH